MISKSKLQCESLEIIFHHLDWYIVSSKAGIAFWFLSNHYGGNNRDAGAINTK